MTLEIKICMGSACYVKGNREILKFLKEYISENNLEDEISLSGELCANKCGDGPRIVVNGKDYKRVTKETVLEILKGC